MSDQTVDQFIAGVPESFASIIRTLATTIISAQPSLECAIKWKQLTFAHNGDFHHWICAIASTKKAASLKFHFGGILDDPKRVFRAGTSKFLRSIDFTTLAEVNARLVVDYVAEALRKLEDFKKAWKSREGEK